MPIEHQPFLLKLNPLLEFAAAVFANCANNPLEALDTVEQALANQGVQGKVLVDLLLSNGHKGYRYFAGEFDGKRFSAGAGFTPDHTDYPSYSRMSAAVLREHVGSIDGFESVA
jgi:hypothetical protein